MQKEQAQQRKQNKLPGWSYQERALLIVPPNHLPAVRFVEYEPIFSLHVA
jgi:hypothetical protein